MHKKIALTISLFSLLAGLLLVTFSHVMIRHTAKIKLQEFVLSKYYFYQSIIAKKIIHESEKYILEKFIEQDQKSISSIQYVLLDENFKVILPVQWNDKENLDFILNKYKKLNKKDPLHIVDAAHYNSFLALFQISSKKKSPYYIFIKSNLFAHQTSMFLLGLYILVIIIAGMIWLISKERLNDFTSIIISLSHSIKAFALKKAVNTIDYTKDDEIGTLIQAYNTLIQQSELPTYLPHTNNNALSLSNQNNDSLNNSWKSLPKLQKFEIILYPKDLHKDTKQILLVKEQGSMCHLAIILIQDNSIDYNEFTNWKIKLQEDFEEAVSVGRSALEIASLLNKILNTQKLYFPQLIYIFLDDENESANFFKTDYFISFKTSIMKHKQPIVSIPYTHIELPVQVDTLEVIDFLPSDICFIMKDSIMKVVNLDLIKQEIQNLNIDVSTAKDYTKEIIKLLYSHSNDYHKSTDNFLDFLVAIYYKG